MFLKLTDNETGADVYLNPLHIIRFIPNSAGEGTLIYLDSDAGLAPAGQPQITHVHESPDLVFQMISRNEKTPGSSGAGKRGFI